MLPGQRPHRRHGGQWILAGATALAIATPAWAQDAPDATVPEASAGGGSEDLARQLSNPVASLISLPIQANWDLGGGADGDGIKITSNVQPVIPIGIGNWNMIVRTIVPIIYQHDISSDNATQFGLGDTTQSFFFSPKETGPSGIVWGVGPAFLYPAATDPLLSGRKWGAGPTAVLLKQSGKNTVGFLGNHIWSVAGDDDRPDISSTFLQPFFSHTSATATTYSINTETSYDWKRDQWVVPINVSVAQLTRMGKQPIQVGVGARYYLEKPTGGPDWGARLVLTFLFPKK